MARKTSSRPRTRKAGASAEGTAAPSGDETLPGAAEAAETPAAAEPQPAVKPRSRSRAKAADTPSEEKDYLGDPEPETPPPAAPASDGADPEMVATGTTPQDAPVADPEPALIEPDAAPTEEREAAVPDPDADAEPESLLSPPATEFAPGTPNPPPAEAPATPPVAPPVPPAARASGGAMSLVLGGVVAAILGALAVLIVLPQGWRGAPTPDGALASRVQALEARTAPDLAPLEARIATLESAAPADTGALADRLAALESRPVPELAPLEARIAALESAPAPAADTEAALAALTARLDAQQAETDARIAAAVDSAMAEATAALTARASGLDAREEDVAAAQQRIAERAALAELVAAAESGDPVPGALATLPEAPAALAPMAEGLPTLAALQSAFAPAARAALAAVPVPADASLTDRLADFLRAQTGARSLAPREGDDTDAVLSRAEAVLRTGNLSGALGELDALTGDPAAAMADWRARAETRLAALAALADLQAHMNHGE